MKKMLYPYAKELERQRKHTLPVPPTEDEPDFISNAPNYEKFNGWSPEEVLVWLNID